MKYNKQAIIANAAASVVLFVILALIAACIQVLKGILK